MPPLVVWFDALIVGFSIVMMASGLAFVLGVMGIMQWSHGQFYMVSAFIVYSLFAQMGLNYFVTLIISTVAIAILGVLVERILIRPVADKGFLASSVVTLGLSFAIQGFITVLYGPNIKAVPTVLEGKVAVGGSFISWQRLLVVILAIAAMIGLYFFVNKTKMGLSMRAASQDRPIAGLFGVRTGRVFSIVMVVGSGLAALAGGLLAPVYSVDPTIGGRPLTLALLAIVLGGMGSFLGAVVGGLIFGFASMILNFYIGPWYEFVLFAVVIAVILVRPQGLFGMSEGRV